MAEECMCVSVALERYTGVVIQFFILILFGYTYNVLNRYFLCCNFVIGPTLSLFHFILIIMYSVVVNKIIIIIICQPGIRISKYTHY